MHICSKMHCCFWLIHGNKFLISVDEVTLKYYWILSFRSSQWEMKSWTQSEGNEAGALSTLMQSTPDARHSISHLGKVTISKKSLVLASSQWRKGLMHLIYEETFPKPKAMNHYLKPFQPAVFFFNLPSLPTSWPRSLRNSLRALFLLPAHLAYLVLFRTLRLFGRRRE